MRRRTTLALLVSTAGLWLCAAAAGAHAQGDAARRGEYLVAIMDCRGCHTEGALTGNPNSALDLAGSTVGFGAPGLGVFYPRNLTPDRETGLGSWTEADIARAIRTGERPDGRILAPMMPWRSYAALTDGDALAVATYLKALPPVRHAVPPPSEPGQKPPSPYLAVVSPE